MSPEPDCSLILVLSVPPGPCYAGFALKPVLTVRNDGPEPIDRLVASLSIAGEDGVERAAVASFQFDVPAQGEVRVFPDMGDPLPTHPAWRGLFWIEAVVKRHNRPLVRTALTVELGGQPNPVG